MCVFFLSQGGRKHLSTFLSKSIFFFLHRLDNINLMPRVSEETGFGGQCDSETNLFLNFTHKQEVFSLGRQSSGGWDGSCGRLCHECTPAVPLVMGKSKVHT